MMRDARTAALIHQLQQVELPTLGHFLERGFCAPHIRRMNPGKRMVGRAVTLDLTEPDAVAVNRALVELRHGDVLAIRVRGGLHACVGAVSIAAAASRGAAGIVVDGPITDLAAIQDSTVPTYAHGTTARTTKLIESSVVVHQEEIEIGGAAIRPGDVIAGDENGVAVFDPDTFDTSVLERARRSDAAEPGLLRRIAAGEPLENLLNIRRA